ncbi:MAG: 4Fe-4S ferredoxin, partial [Lachnospiraceae bacterium]|nr:4Fe-4S ferredoxin [Lachnospiraceae bacterium]
MTYNIFFSPTGTTEKVVKHIGKSFSAVENIDISEPDLSNYIMNTDDFCIVGVPSFGGRVPEAAILRLQKIRGDRTPVFLLVTYGGRAYEDTLKELKDLLEKQNFICIG